MARVNLRCTSCGFHFTATDAQIAKPEGVGCPSCMAPVGVNGPVEGTPPRKSVRVLEASPDLGGLKVKIGIGVGVGVLVIGIVAVLILKGGSSADPADKEPPAPKRPTVPVAAQKKETTTPQKVAAAPKPGTTSKADETSAPAPAPQFSAPATPASTPAPQSAPPLPADVLQTLRQERPALKDWHLNQAVSAPEKARLDALLAAGKGSGDDAEFLRSVLEGPRFLAVKEDAQMIRDGFARLETEALEGLPVDKVVMNDNRVLHGIILEQTDTLVKLERKIAVGSKSVFPLQKAEIKDVQKGKGLGSEFKTSWEAAKKGGPAALGALLGWCKENSLPLQASLVAHAILVDDPGRKDARLEAGLAADPVARMLEAEKQGGFIAYEGRRWVPRELKEKLLRDKNALVDGHWMKGEQRLFPLPGLFRDNPNKVQVQGTLAQEEVITYNVASGTEKAETSVKRRFYAATAMVLTQSRKKKEDGRDADEIIIEDKGNPASGEEMRGEVTITVPLYAPILEGTVTATADVNGTGKIVMSAVIDGRRILLGSWSSKGEKSFKLPDEIRGKSDVLLVAELSGKAGYGTRTDTKRAKRSKKDSDKVIERGLDYTFKQLIPEYPAMLFPSTQNTQEVFRLTALVGEPAPQLDKLFEKCPEVLKK